MSHLVLPSRATASALVAFESIALVGLARLLVAEILTGVETRSVAVLSKGSKAIASLGSHVASSLKTSTTLISFACEQSDTGPTVTTSRKEAKTLSAIAIVVVFA